MADDPTSYGYIRISRKLYETDRFWNEPRVFSRHEAWEDMIQMAAWKDHTRLVKNEMVELKRGELLASIRFLARRWKWGEKRVRLFLDLVLSMGQIRTQRETQAGAVYLLVKYEDYQSPTPGRAHQRAQEGHSKGTKRSNEEVRDEAEASSHERFEAFWKDYPKRTGGNPKQAALRAWNARIREGADPDAIVQGRNRYIAYLRADGRIGTKYVLQAVTFLGPDCRWLDEWTPEPRTGKQTPQQYDYSDAATTQFRGFKL
jgi:hypothetical protein